VSAGAQAVDAVASRRLALLYHPHSFSVFALAGAARTLCELVWIVDTTIDGTEAMLPMLERMGTVVDVTGLDQEATVAAMAAQRPDGILTLKDSLMQRTAALAERLALPFHDSEVARRFTDKHLQRVALRDGGVPVPGFWEVPELADAAAWESLHALASFPAVLKPRYNSEGSRDTIRVESIEQVRAAVGFGAEAGERFVLEEYLGDRRDGVRAGFADYVSVESIVSNGEVSQLAVTGRFPPAEPFRESGFFIDAELSEADRRRALAAARAAVAALGVRIGALHTEIKFTPDGPRVIELNGRIGGGVPEMLHDATGVELLAIALRLALGESVVFAAPPVSSRVAYLFYVQAPLWMTTVTRVDGLDRLAADPAVSELTLNRGPGQCVDWREGNHGHVFSVGGTVADHDALIAFERRIHDEVTIEGVGDDAVPCGGDPAHAAA
jgi:biotin carboxylase